MALVAYDYSDSESDIESEDEKNNDGKQTSFCELFSSLPKSKPFHESADEETKPTAFSELFDSLPKPKEAVITEEDDDIPLNNNGPKKNGTKEPVKISIPALSNYDSDEEEPPKKIIMKAPEKASGLFALLPNPKCTPLGMDATFDAKVVKQKNLVPRTVKAKATATKRQHDSDDEEISSSNFFSFTDTTKINSAPAIPRPVNMYLDPAKPVKDMNSKSNSFFSDMVSIAGKPVAGPQPEPVEEADAFEENAVEELCGKRKRKAKKNKIDFIDINAADVMPDPREWRTKALTEEAPSAAVAKGEEPSQQSRRKHQITYLAYQAKVNEQELKNQWALNRMTRKQTQAKYGF